LGKVILKGKANESFFNDSRKDKREVGVPPLLVPPTMRDFLLSPMVV